MLDVLERVLLLLVLVLLACCATNIYNAQCPMPRLLSLARIRRDRAPPGHLTLTFSTSSSMDIVQPQCEVLGA